MEDYQIILHSDGEVEIIDHVASYDREVEDNNFDLIQFEKNVEEDLRILEELRIMLESN
jgi:hypothetical protein